MIKLKVLSTAAAIALVAPMFASSASFAQERGSFGGGVGGMRAGGGAPSAAFGRSAVTSAPASSAAARQAAATPAVIKAAGMGAAGTTVKTAATGPARLPARW